MYSVSVFPKLTNVCLAAPKTFVSFNSKPAVTDIQLQLKDRQVISMCQSSGDTKALFRVNVKLLIWIYTSLWRNHHIYHNYIPIIKCRKKKGEL